MATKSKEERLKEKAQQAKEILNRQNLNTVKSIGNDIYSKVQKQNFEAARSSTPKAASGILERISKPYTPSADNLSFAERSAVQQFPNASKSVTHRVTNTQKRATENYMNNVLSLYDQWKSQRPASYQEAAASGAYSQEELNELNRNSKANILEQAEWDRTQRETGINDTWENALSDLSSTSSDYLKYLNEVVIPQNLNAIQANNDQVNEAFENGSAYSIEKASDQNRAIIDAVTDIYQGGGEIANAKDRALVREVFGSDLSDADVNAILSQIHTDPEAFLEKAVVDTDSIEVPTYDNSTSAYEQLGEDISSELANREAYNTLMSEAKASPTYEQDRVFKPVEAGYMSSSKQDNMDNLYMWLNDTAYRSEYDIRHADGIQYFKERGYDLMTEDELAGFNAAYANGYESAERYLSSLESTGVLNRRRAEAQVYNYTNVAENHPILSKGVTFGTTAANAVVAPIQLAAAATGLETDPNSSLYDLNRFNTTVRGTVNQMANEVTPVLGFVDNVLTSVFDNLIAVYTSKGIAGAAGVTGDAANKLVTGLTQSIMSSNSASSELFESLQNGDNQATAVMKALASGGIEALTEKYSIETLLGDPKGAWKYFAKNFLAEGSEEVASDLLNPLADKFISGITGSRTDIEKEYNNYLLQGYSEKEASDMVMNGFVKGLVYDFFAGAFAGGLGASTFIANNAYQGRQLNKNGAGNELVQIAKAMPEGSKSRKYADAVERTGSNYSTAQLYAALSEEMPTASQETLDSITAGSLARQLQSEGEEGNVDSIARSVMKVVNGQELTNEERNALVSSKRGVELMNTISSVSQRDSAEIKAYNEAYNAGFYGRESTQNMNQTYYQQGVKDAQAAEQKRLDRVGKGKAGTGSVSYIGTVLDKSGLTTRNATSLDANTLSRLESQQQDAVSAIQEIAKAVTTINFALYEGQADDTGNITVPNGMYDATSNTLYIDLNSGKNRSGQGVVEYTIMQTVGHELTHYIETNSAKGYAVYKDLVRKTLEARGQDFDALVDQKVRNAEANGISLTRDGAVYEVVADASEMMLKDTKALQQLAQQNKSLAEKVKTFVKDLLAKIRKALGKVGAQHPEAKALIEAEQYVAGLQEAWDAALVEAVETVKAQETDVQTDTESGVFSLREEHYDYSKSFAEQIEDWENGAFPAKDALLVGRTPELYRKIGLGDLPLTINQTHVDYVINGTKDSDHYLGKEWLKKLPEMMNDPLAVIQSESNGENSVVVILDTEVDGKQIIAPVYINSESKQNGLRIDSNNVASVFGKNNAVTKLLTNAINKENAPGQGVGIYYWKKSEARSLYEGAGLQLPGSSIQDGLIHSIFDAGSDVNSKMFTSQTETQQFKRWFGDSEVVDDEGNPKIVYHATDAAFTAFDRDKLGSNTRTNTDSEEAARSAEVGFWFSDHDLSGDMYTDNSMPVYLSIKNGYHTSLDNMLDALEDMTAEEYTAEMQGNGYDGLIVQDSEFGGTSYVVFEPEQIKSATDNVGTFDPSNPDIRYSLRAETESDLTRQYLESMEITDSMNESEKWLLGKYQRTQQEIAEKESQIAEQDELKAKAATQDERTKAENRAKILRDQVKRLRNAMRTMERSDGFGGLMRRSEDVVKRFMQYSDMTQATDLSDQLNADLTSLNSQLESAVKTIQSTEGAQRAMLAKGMLNEQSLTQVGKNVRATFGTRMSGKDISNRLALAYAELYATEGEQGTKNFARVMRDLAEDVLRRSNRRYQSATLDNLRENLQGSISLTDAQKQELKNAGISQSEFKRVMSGVVNVSDSGTSLASIVSNAEYYGSGIISQIASTDSEGDMILKLYNLVSEEKAKERSFALDGMNETDSINYTMAEIMSNANIQLAVDQNTMDAIQTAMQQGSEANQKVVSKINAAMKGVRSAKITGEQLWRSAANADQTARQALEYYRAIDEQRRILEEKEIVQQLKSDAVSKLREERTIREYAQKATSRMRHIRKTVKGLNDMLLHETDYKNVPEELKAYVGDVVTTFGEKFGSMVFSGKQAKELLATYEKLRNSDSSFMQAQYDEDLASTLHALNEWAEKYQQLKESGKNRLEKAQLRILITEAVDDLVSNVKAMVRNSTETRINGRKKMFADIADSAINEMMERPDHTTYQNKLGDAAAWLERAIVTGNTTPVYFFDQLGNTQFKNLFKDFQNGQEKWAFISAASKQRIQEFRQAYNYDAWSDADALTFTTQQGHEITLDKEQALWLYATWKREHANPIAATEHLTKGGFVYEGNKGTASGKGLFGQKAAEITTGNRITETDMKAVYGYLTEQEKGYADAMVNYLSTEIGALGNEISMELFGIRKYKEGYYFPYATARDQRFQKSASGGGATTDDSRIKHASFTHALTRGAATTLVMGNFTDVVANHIGQMALYSSMTLPIENMNRVLNYRFATEDGGTTTMRSLIRQKYGSNTLNYMERFLRDMNGGIRGTDKSAFQKTISLFKKSAVVASLSVSLQQTSAMLRAGAMMNYKYLLQTPANYKAEYDQLMQHSGVAIVKQMGRFDTNVGQSYNEWLLSPEESNLKLWSKARQALFLDGKDAARSRWETLVTGLPNTMDEVAWSMMWKAVKSEQADLHPDMDVNSNEFLDMCGKRFNDIAYHTQVFDSTLTRSQLMRSTNPIDQMATAFRAEPTLTLNVLYDAFFNKNIPKGERASRRVSALSAVMLSSIAAAFGSAMISAWGNDDDDRTAAEKLVRTTNENFWSNLLPWYNIPYISDIVSLMQGYDVERADMSLFQDVVNGFNKVQQWREGNTTWYRAMEEFVGSLANFLGIPAKNLMRDARRIYNMTNTRWEKPTQTGMEAALVPDSVLPFLEYDTSTTAYYERLVSAYAKGDTAKARDIETYIQTVGGKDADQIRSGVKSAVADRFEAGTMTEEEATNLLYKLYGNEKGFDKDSLYYYFDKLKDKMSGKLQEGETYSKFNDFYTAVETGKNLKAEISELTSHGTTKQSIASAITSQFKETYISLYKTNKTEASRLQARLLTAYEALGYKREDKIKDIQKWVENDERKTSK